MYVHRILCSTTNMHFNITQHVVNTFSWLQNREYSQSSISGRRKKKTAVQRQYNPVSSHDSQKINDF